MTDRERLLELADAVMMTSHNGWSHGHNNKDLCSLCKLVSLATQVLVDKGLQQAKARQFSASPPDVDADAGLADACEVFEELDEESQYWENEGG